MAFLPVTIVIPEKSGIHNQEWTQKDSGFIATKYTLKLRKTFEQGGFSPLQILCP